MTYSELVKLLKKSGCRVVREGAATKYGTVRKQESNSLLADIIRRR